MDVELDLNISNYNFCDILNLFKIPTHFTEKHMRDAKMIVMRTHPDKSGLDKKYFLFFSKAYKLLYEVYQVRSGSSRETNTTYDELKSGVEFQMNSIKNSLKNMDANKFNTWFNELFEKNRICDEENDSGYGNWLKEESNENFNIQEQGSWAQGMKQLEERKKKLREQALTVKTEVRSFNTMNGGSMYDLTRQCPEDHSRGFTFGVSNGLVYEDLKKAHTETVIPVTHEDYTNSRRYSSLNEIQMARDVDSKTYSCENNAMSQHHAREEEENMCRAFKLAQQDEIAREWHKKIQSQFNLIEN